MKNKKQNKKVDFQAEVLRYLAEIAKSVCGGQVVKASQEVGSSDSRFIDCGDGTIKDTKTGLMWDKEGRAETINYEKAEKYCKDLSVAGHKDWRLPTVEELESLVDRKKYNPAIVSDLFKVKTDDWYWTSTNHAGNSGGAWVVHFYLGYVNWFGLDFSHCVRAVRQY